MKKGLYIFAATIIILLSGCSTKSEAGKWTENEFPRIDGSTATIPLGQAVTATLLGKSRDEAMAYTEFTGTNSAYLKLANNETDLLIVYEGSRETMEQLGDIFEIAPVGRDALVFLVNVKNPIDSLTTEQIQSIYKGEITSWKDVGGEESEILAYQRNETSGSQTMMKKLVMNDMKMANPEGGLVVGEMGALVNYIASYDNSNSAIGYNVYYYVTQMKLDENIKLLSVDGVTPAPETISKGEYPFINDFFAVIRKDAPQDSPERRLFVWLQGEEAKKLMESEGYVPVK